MRWILATGVAVAAASAPMWAAAQAANEVRYGPVPAWVRPVQAPALSPDANAALELVLLDVQLRYETDSVAFFDRRIVRINQPQGLQPLGNVYYSWNPETEALTVHALKVRRNGQEIDLLADHRFEILRREENLEAAALDGRLTASIQIPGLQVGDELEAVTTVQRRDPTMGGHSDPDFAIGPSASKGRFRVSLSWPDGRVRWRSTHPDFNPVETRADGRTELVYDVTGLPARPAPDSAPVRYRFPRGIETSTFADWSAVAAVLHPRYVEAARLAPNSAVRAEAARIAAQTRDPVRRAELALELVQEQVRYVYIGMNLGGYRPASADETWTRRFGDCKGKTALLLALLRELGVQAEAAFVNTELGDGLDQRLPRLAAFDHVLVRAVIGGKTYWMDGTRVGDRRLATLEVPPFRWALPVRASGSQLERLSPVPVRDPYLERTFVADLSAGGDAPGRAYVDYVIRGDTAVSVGRALQGASAEEAERAVRTSQENEFDGFRVDDVTWNFDPIRRELSMSLDGTYEAEWDAGGGERWIWAPQTYLSLPEFRRPREQDQNAPYALDHPTFVRYVTMIRMPRTGVLSAGGYVDETVAQTRYYQAAQTLPRSGLAYVVTEARTLAPEITSEEAAQANRRRRQPDAPDGSISLSLHDVDDQGRPTDTQGWAALARARMAQGDYVEALSALDEAQKDAPASARAGLTELRESLDDLRKGSQPRDLSVVEAELAAAPPGEERDALIVERAALLREAGRSAEADAALKAALRAAPNSRALAFEYALNAVGDDAGALAAADRLVESAPNDPELRRLRASVHRGADRLALALIDMDKAVEQEPDFVLNFLSRGLLLKRMGRTADAIADLRQAVRMDPRMIESWDALADAVLAEGREDEAVRLLDRALLAAPERATVYNNRCWMLARHNRALDRAKADCDEALKLEPGEAAFLDSRGFAHLQAGRLAEAIADYDAALAKAPRQAPSLYGRGVARVRAGQADAGRADIAAALAIDPDVRAQFAPARLEP